CRDKTTFGPDHLVAVTGDIQRLRTNGVGTHTNVIVVVNSSVPLRFRHCHEVRLSQRSRSPTPGFAVDIESQADREDVVIVRLTGDQKRVVLQQMLTREVGLTQLVSITERL